MRIWVLTLLFLFPLFFLSGSICFSQNQEVDSLKHELAIAKTDTSGVMLLANICRTLGGIKPDSALQFGEEALVLARKIGFPKGEIRALSFTSGVLNNTGNIPRALSMAFEALQIAEKNMRDKEKKWAFINISQVYATLKDFSKAISFRKKALQIAEAAKDTNSIIIENSNLGNRYLEKGQLDSASFFQNRALVLNRGNGRPYIFEGLGQIEAKKGNNVLAMNYYQKALNLVDSNSHRIISRVYMSMASLYKNENKWDSSIYYAENALAEAQLVILKQNIIEASLLLSELYELVDSKESYRYYKLATITKESLFGAGNIQVLQDMIAQEEERQKEVGRARAAFQDRLKQYALITGLAVFLLLAFIFYKNNRKQKQANTLLRHQKEEIQTTLTQLKSTQSQLIQSEKMASLGELTAGIAHEIQNPLNFVNNFSEINKELLNEMKGEIDKGNTEEVKAIAGTIIENEEKISNHGKRADFIVKGMLQHSRSSSHVKEPTDLNSLVEEYLRLAYHACLAGRQGLRAKNNDFVARLETNFDPSVKKVEIVPQGIGRVVLNLINNAFYAVSQNPPLGAGGPNISRLFG